MTNIKNAITELQVANIGPLSDLLADASVTEILINSASEVWFERHGHLHLHNQTFESELTFHNFYQRLCSEAHLRVDIETPHADGEWRGFRVHTIHHPLSRNGAHVSLRRKSPQTWCLDDLLQRQWATPEAINLLRHKLQSKKSLLVVGATGSGKTSVLNACLKELPLNERIITIEDTDEIHLPNAASVKLLTRASTNLELRPYTQADLLKQSLRMRPDRIVVGEVRGTEAKDLLLALSTGHGGSLATLHASSARQALLRLEMLIQMGAPEWRLETVRNLIHLGLDSVVVVKKENGVRRLDGIFEIASLEEAGFCLERLV